MNEAPSPNQDARPPGAPIDILMLHYTGMQSGQAAIDRLRDPASRVSSHYVVEEDGAVWRLVPEARRAWHAGVSSWRGRQGLNDGSIGIEIVNPGHEWGYRAFPPTQMAAVFELCRSILARHPIPARNIVGHSDVAPDRKQDPGELFDWQGLARHGIGQWPDRPGTAVTDPTAALRTIGYPIPTLPLTLTAFQRRYLPHAVTGKPDPETLSQIGAVLERVTAA